MQKPPRPCGARRVGTASATLPQLPGNTPQQFGESQRFHRKVRALVAETWENKSISRVTQKGQGNDISYGLCRCTLRGHVSPREGTTIRFHNVHVICGPCHVGKIEPSRNIPNNFRCVAAKPSVPFYVREALCVGGAATPESTLDLSKRW